MLSHTARLGPPLALIGLALLSLTISTTADQVVIKGDAQAKQQQEQEQQQEQVGYRVPNPFNLHELPTTSAGRQEFFYFKSTQSSSATHKRHRKVLVEEYFSLGLGLTFSLHRDSERPDEPWLIVGDSARSRFYVVRNPESGSGADTLDEPLDCELDHAHNHRQVFPWQYVYDLKQDGAQQRSSPKRTTNKSGKTNTERRARNRRSKAFVYGVGAIWLNAIASDARSQQVGSKSPYELSNSWFLAGKNNLQVELLFEKLADESVDPLEYQNQLDRAHLNTIKVDRSAVVENPLSAKGDVTQEVVHVTGHGTEYIVIEAFRSGRTRDNEPELARYLAQLELCRQQTKRHRLFPSLLRSLSTSPERSYKMHYIAHRLPLYDGGSGRRAEGKYDDLKHRYTFATEFVTELFSLKHEAQTLIYSPLPIDTDESTHPGQGRTDVFIARFTERANNARSSRHSTAHYHLIENDELINNFADLDAEPICKVGEREPLPRERIFARPLDFRRETSGSAISYNGGHLVGLGALLMNAADSHYKTFSLTTQRIKVAQNPHDLNELRTARVDEWRLEDDKLGWSFHFFIEHRERSTREQLPLDLTERARDELSRLIRIDVRDYRKVDDISDEVAIESSSSSKAGGEEQWDDHNLLMQFTIVEMSFETHEEEATFLLTPPASCEQASSQKKPTPSQDDSDSDSDANSHYDDPEYYNKDRYYNKYSSDEDDDDNDSDAEDSKENQIGEDIEQQQGEEFEFDPGSINEDLELPEFFDYLEERSVYEISSTITLEMSGDEQSFVGKRHVWLRELIDLEHESALIEVYNSDQLYELREPAESYYIFYDSELVFRLAQGRCTHYDDLPASNKWLRLLSAPLTYYTVPNYRGKKHEVDLLKNEAVIESNRIALYGLGALWRRASSSEFAEFLGKRRGQVEIEGYKYERLVWLYEEHEMAIHFNFLRNLSMIEWAQKNKKQLQQHHYLTLDTIEFRNEFQDDQYQLSAIGRVSVQLKSFDSLHWATAPPNDGSTYVGKPLQVPDLCRDQFIEAQRMRERLEDDVRMPSFFELAGGQSPTYQMHYILSHRLGADFQDPASKSASVFITESFDRDLNRGKLVVRSDLQELTVFIDGKAKRIYAYSEPAGSEPKCAYIASLKSIFSSALGGLEFEDNVQFDLDKMYGLANLWLELAKLRGTMRVHSYQDRHGHKTELRSYYFKLGSTTSGDLSLHASEEKEIQVTFRVKRSRLAISDKQQTHQVIDGIKARAQEELQLESIQVVPVLDRGQATVVKKQQFKFYKWRVYVDDVTPFVKVDWKLPAPCAALAPNAPVEEGPPAAGEKKGDEKGAQQGGGGGGGGGGDKRPPEGQAISGYAFPKLSELLPRLNQFHMRSQVSIQKALNKVYLLDEWAHNGHVRMRSRGIGRAAERNFDFIIYENTKEQFDLSQAFKCRARHFPENALELAPGQLISANNLLDVWVDDSTLINHLSNAYYSPLTLWRMAEKPGVEVKLDSSLEIAPLPVDTNKNNYMKQLEQELMRETWLVSEPKAGWSYRMQFLKNSQVLEGGQLHEWHVLEKIELVDREPEPANEAEKLKYSHVREYQVTIEVMNYKYDAQPDDILENFRLPEGWGCRRNVDYVQMRDTYDEMVMDPADNWLLTYEASLELFNADAKLVDPQQQQQQRQLQDIELGSLDSWTSNLERETLPTMSGLFLKSGSRLAKTTGQSGQLVDLTTHHNQLRFPDGTSLSRKIVQDRTRNIEYEINRANGFCTMALVAGPSWLLEFPRARTAPTTAAAIEPPESFQINLMATEELRETLFSELFMETILPGTNDETVFAPLNDFAINGESFHTSYERELNWLTLNDKIQGPARVVRKFTRAPHHSEPASAMQSLQVNGHRRVIRLHDSVSVRVLIFDATKSHLRAVLDLTMRRKGGPEPPLSRLLAASSVRQCYNDGDSHWDKQLAEFTLEYPIRDEFMRLTAHYYSSTAKDIFYESLMGATGLLPLQLDGEARFELGQHDNLLRVHFNVMEPPTSYVYFREILHATMKDQLELIAEIRLAPQLIDCSRWCDQINCVAMSYCADRTCRVVTARALFGSMVASVDSNKPQLLDDDQRKRLANWSKQDDACSYYYTDRSTARRSLARLADYLDRAVNQERRASQLRRLALTLGGPYSEIEPVRFYEHSNKFRWQHEDSDEPLESQATLGDSQQPGGSLGGKLDRKSTYGLLASGRTISVGDFEQLKSQQPQGELAHFVSVIAHASSEAECLEACERNQCLLLSHCTEGSKCLLIHLAPESATADRSNNEDLMVADIHQLRERTFVDSPKCNILMRDQRAKFAKFESTFAPQRHDKRLDGYSALECAATCQAAGQQCLSFDLCRFEPDEATRDEETVCLLQKTHLTSDSFDRSIVLPEWDQTSEGGHRLSGRNVECDHYSKNLLADFRRLANKKLTKKIYSAIRGISEDHCAADCLEDERCHGFEFCRNDRKHPAQACYLIRTDDLLEAEDEPDHFDKLTDKHLSEKLTSSKVCSIYVARRFAQKDRLQHTSALLTDRGSGPQDSNGFLKVLLYLLIALSVGATVQFVYMKLTRKPLIFTG